MLTFIAGLQSNKLFRPRRRMARKHSTQTANAKPSFGHVFAVSSATTFIFPSNTSATAMSTGSKATSTSSVMFNGSKPEASTLVTTSVIKPPTTQQADIKLSPGLTSKNVTPTNDTKAVLNTEVSSTFATLSATFGSSVNSRSTTFQTAGKPLFGFSCPGNTKDQILTPGTKPISTTKVNSPAVDGYIGNFDQVTSVDTKTTFTSNDTKSASSFIFSDGNNTKVFTSGPSQTGALTSSKDNVCDAKTTNVKQTAAFGSSIGNNAGDNTNSVNSTNLFTSTQNSTDQIGRSTVFSDGPSEGHNNKETNPENESDKVTKPTTSTIPPSLQVQCLEDVKVAETIQAENISISKKIANETKENSKSEETSVNEDQESFVEEEDDNNNVIKEDKNMEELDNLLSNLSL